MRANCFHKEWLKQYYKMWWERTNFTFHFFSSYIYVMTLVSPYFKPSVYSCWVLCVICNIVHSMSSHSLPQCKLYRDPGKGKVIADCVITTTPIALIFTRYCLFFMLYQFISTVENLLSKMYIEGALMSKSRNIALRRTEYNEWLN